MQQNALQLKAYTIFKFICLKIRVYTVPEMTRQPSVAERWLASILKDYACTHHKCFKTLLCEYDLVIEIGQSRRGEHLNLSSALICEKPCVAVFYTHHQYQNAVNNSWDLTPLISRYHFLAIFQLLP
jgi:hypothetical protein